MHARRCRLLRSSRTSSDDHLEHELPLNGPFISRIRFALWFGRRSLPDRRRGPHLSDRLHHEGGGGRADEGEEQQNFHRSPLGRWLFRARLPGRLHMLAAAFSDATKLPSWTYRRGRNASEAFSSKLQNPFDGTLDAALWALKYREEVGHASQAFHDERPELLRAVRRRPKSGERYARRGHRDRSRHRQRAEPKGRRSRHRSRSSESSPIATSA
jgi:hypothetical protein